MKDKLIQITFYLLLAALIATGMFFIVYNATWLVGDDSACIVHTGWGNYYSLSDYIIPKTGRFYPMAFMLYNVLPMLGLSSVAAHFTLHAVVFALMLLCMCWVCRKSMSSAKMSIWDYIILLSIVAFCWARSYRYFLSTEWSIWIDYILVIIWALSTYYVHEKQSITAAIVGLMAITYFNYCLEVNSAISFVYGFAGLLFLRKSSSKLEKIYYIGSILTAIIYFVLYYFLVYAHIGDNIYDASHGENLALWQVVLKMFIAQKPFWIGLVILGVRGWQIIKHKANYEWWDALILSGFAYAGGCAVMHLHHTVYYWTAALCMLPAIVHYLYNWVGNKWTAIIMLVMALVMCHKLPKVISENQADREASVQLQQILKAHIEAGDNVYYYAPYAESDGSNAYEWRQQKEDCLPAYIGDFLNNKKYPLEVVTEYSGTPGVYILPKENEALAPGANDQLIQQGDVIFKGGYGDLSIVIIERLLTCEWLRGGG